MDSIYFDDHLAQADRARVVPLRAAGRSRPCDVLLEAHKLRVERGDYNIAPERLETRYREPRHPFMRVAVRMRRPGAGPARTLT